ncbi:MAG: DNA repair protein RadC [Lachnospiraceae bacterium]|nr:DNA repair protein RadC [Lachnospiraceae bacterium]
MNEISTIRDMKKEYRPYEKCLAYGAEALNEQELLAVIIRTGSKGESSIKLAERILSLSEGNKGILGLMHLSIEELMSVKGIGAVKAIQIKCIVELSRRISKANARTGLNLSDPASIADYYMEDLRHLEREQLILVMMNTKNRLIRDTVMTTGTVNASLVSTREVFVEALKCSAVYIVLVHNHPSGDPTPSREDIINTKQIKDAGNLIGITLLDHIIIGDNKYISLRQRGIL